MNISKPNSKIFNSDLIDKFKKQPGLLRSAMMSFPIALISLILAFYFLLSTTVKINQTDFPPQESQLLNRTSIEEAAQLLSEETIDFNLN